MRLIIEGPIELHVHYHPDAETAAQLNRIEAKLTAVKREEDQLMSKAQDLQDAVAAEKTVEDSAVALLNGIAQQLTTALASSTPDTAVQAVIDSIKANTDTMSAAVTANTPAAPAGNPAPPPAVGP